MAQIGSDNNGRSVNTDLNIVPFIDLMSVLITFLLITAVWSQVSMIQIGSSIYGKQSNNEPPPPPPPGIDMPLRLDVKSEGFRLLIGKDTFQFPKVQTKYETLRLFERLQKIKSAYPEKSDAVITVDDEVAYEFMILGMDLLLQSGFSSISVATGGAE